jgi:hypothetical protein
MIKALTEANREDKGAVDPASRSSLHASKRTLRAVFPSYFNDFCVPKHFLMLPVNTTRTECRRNQKDGIHPAAAIMAIV